MARVLILDFGSQTTQLIARRVRELGVYSEILPCTVSPDRVAAFNPDAIILSGGPASVSAENAPRAPEGLWTLPVPMLGICYGLQLMVERHGGTVLGAESREFGRAELQLLGSSALFKSVGEHSRVWMSHGDQIAQLPEGVVTLAKSATCPHAAVELTGGPGPRMGVQFHPEVVHSVDGTTILGNFLFQVAGLKADWSAGSQVDHKIRDIKAQVGDGKVVMGLSGGVDSSVAAALIHRALGDALTCVFVDTGLHRHQEREQVEELFGKSFGLNLIVAEAQDKFMAGLAGVVDPEEKRKRIGHAFIEVFEAEANRLQGVNFLGQGTLYPDVIESVSFAGGPSDVIKSHHNVGGLPERMELSLVEPLRELFKDEVRELGKALGLPDDVLLRQPFPGPGFAVRILGEVTAERCTVLRQADWIIQQEIGRAIDEGQLPRPWQWFGVLLPVQTVGVMGDARTYEQVIAVRCVDSQDGMTADWVDIPKPVLESVSNRIINEVRGVNRVVYDISSKPPATIEWE